jgi:acetyl-CoA carboxylase biotin carboxyl carrier protein
VSGGADWLEAVRRVVDLARASDVTELQLANNDFALRVRREPRATQDSLAGQRTHDGEALLGKVQPVAAPFTGVFYRSPTPAARAYVDEGDWVDADSVIGLVETMKIFNEVTADCSGRIARFAVDNGALVHAGDTLVLIEPGERTAAESEPRL